MKAITACIKGLEFVCIQEIKEILKTNAETIFPSRVLFNVKNEKELAQFIYYSRSTIKSYLILERIEFSTKEEIINKIQQIKFPYLKNSFVVRCERIGNHDFSSQDIEKEAGEIIYTKTKIKVDLEDPETTILIDIIDNNCLIGIDLTGIKLSKRDYRVKLTSNPLNPCIAYSLVRIAEIKPTDRILDPFCKSGEIPIEAAQYLLQIPNCLKLNDKLLFNKIINVKFKDTTKKKKLTIFGVDSQQNNLSCAEINAKIGYVKASIKFSRLKIEWLDTKFKKNSIDKIITFPIYSTNSLPEKTVEKIYKELFYQLDFILKKDGSITILTPMPESIEKYAQEYKFKKDKKFEIEYTNKKFFIIIFKK